MSLQLWEILVPAADSDGERIPVEYHQMWDQMIRARCGGLTILKTAKGQWVDPSGRLYAEPMIPVRVACLPEQIGELLDLTIDHYRQQAVMAYRLSEQVLIRRASD